MKKRILGRTGILVSEIAFGGVEIGMPYGIGSSHAGHMLPEAAAVELIHEALHKGINYFDTARMYGSSEAIMGKAFSGKRQQAVISTKCRHFRGKDGQLPENGVLKQLIEQSLSESLQALQTDYVDVFMLHQADTAILQHPGIKEVFSQIKVSGKARAIGVSTYTVNETREAIQQGIWDVVQLPFNLMDQRQQLCFREAQEKGVAVTVRSVLLKGLLSNRAAHLHPALQQIRSHIDRYQALLTEDIRELPALAIKFALSFPDVCSVLVGIDKTEYLDQSLASASGPHLSADMLQKARGLAYPDPAFLDLPLWEQKGWLT